MDKSNLKLFIGKTGLIAISFLGLCLLVTTIGYSLLGDRPLTDVEDGFLIKKDETARADKRVNTIFIGSSITFRQIDPSAFDADASNNGEFYSYNLGTPGLYPMRSISYLEHVIEMPPPKVKYIICELFRLDTVTYNYKSPQTMRITNFRNFVDMLQTIKAANFSFTYKVYLATQYLRSFAFKAFGFGMSSYLSYERVIKPRDSERFEKSLRGFYSKETEIKLSSEPEMVTKLMLIRAVLEEQPELLQKRRALHIAKYARAWQLRNSPYIEKLNGLIGKANKKGIKLIYLLPPLQT